MRTPPSNLAPALPVRMPGGESEGLRKTILARLAFSSSQQPVELSSLYALDRREDVERELLALLRECTVNTCQVTTRGITRSLWWLVGKPRTLPCYGTGIHETRPRKSRRTRGEA